MKSRLTLVACGLVVAMLVSIAWSHRGRSLASRILNESAVRRPAVFERNDGQAPPAYRFLARHVEHEFAFGRDAVAIALARDNGAHIVGLRFDGAQPAEPIAEQPLEGRVNYLRGRDAGRWITDVPTYGLVRYPNLYEGVDAVFYTSDGRVEYDLVVRPHTDASIVAIRFDGARAVRLNDAGDLVVEINDNALVQRKPVVYQSRAGRRTPVDASYRVTGDRVTLALGAYDRDETLVIDPVIAYATDFGGSSLDTVMGIASDAAGNVYAAGMTQSTNLPKTAGAFDTALAPAGANATVSADAFVMKLSSDGKTLVYATYLGGSGIDAARAIAVDASGNAHVTGSTTSFDFPVTASAFDRACGGNCRSSDGFVTRLNATGSALAYSTYLGGASQDEPYAIAVNASGQAIVAGQTTGYDFPVTSGAFQQRFRGWQDGFITKLSTDGSRLAFSTYYGGAGNDDLFAMALDSAGSIYVGGLTTSTDLTVTGAFQPSLAGGDDAWIAKFTGQGLLVFSSYFGGSGGDAIYGLSVSADGIFAVGGTSSISLPGGSVAVVQNEAAFVTHIAPDGLTVRRTRYIDGLNADFARSVIADVTHIVHVFGATSSTNLPISVDAMQVAHSGPVYCCGARGRDAFYVELPIDSTGNMRAPSYLTYLGGKSNDEPLSMASDGKGGVFLGGYNDHHDFPLVNAKYRGTSGADGFIAHIVPTSAFRVSNNRDMVLYVTDWRIVGGDTKLFADPTAANGHYMLTPDKGAPTVTPPMPNPDNGFELQFYAIAGIPYRVWIRGRAQNNSTSNDSVWMQFSDSVDAAGKPIWRMLTHEGMAVSLEECDGCGVSGWGWHDNGSGVGVRGPAVYFAANGYHTIRIQQREDGLAIDQIIISSRQWLTSRPGAPKNSTNVYPKTIIP